jgi:hypothetical protein
MVNEDLLIGFISGLLIGNLVVWWLVWCTHNKY